MGKCSFVPIVQNGRHSWIGVTDNLKRQPNIAEPHQQLALTASEKGNGGKRRKAKRSESIRLNYHLREIRVTSAIEWGRTKDGGIEARTNSRPARRWKNRAPPVVFRRDYAETGKGIELRSTTSGKVLSKETGGGNVIFENPGIRKG